MPAKTDCQIQLTDGRSVGYAEYGDLSGRPVLVFHSLPGSRLELYNPDLIAIAERQRSHLIVLERPGIGLSTFKRYSVAGYPDLVAEVAGKLGLARFALLGLSSGGKFAAACAWKMPGRLSSVTLVSSGAPFDLPGVKETLSKWDARKYAIAVKVPWLFRVYLGVIARGLRKNPPKIINMFPELSPEDKTILAHPDMTNTLGQTVVEAYRRGTRGVALEWKMEALPWGLPLSEIGAAVNIWHGAQDKIISSEQSRILANAIPDARLTIFPNEGRTLFITRFEELLETTVC